MDPISFAASIVGIVTAADQGIKCIKKLCSLRHADAELSYVLKELEGLRAVAQFLNSEDVHLSEQELVHCTENFKEIGKRFEEEIASLKEFIHYKLLKPEAYNDRLQPRPRYLRWKNGQEEVAKRKARIYELRSTLTQIQLVVLQGQMTHLTVEVKNGFQRIDHATKAIQDNKDHLKASQNEPELLASEERPGNVSDIEEYASDVFEKSDTSMSKRTPSVYSIPDDRIQVTMHYKSLALHCSRACRCACHASTRLISPDRLKAVFGQVIFAQVGGTLMNRRACDYIACSRMGKPHFRLWYQFPAWLVHYELDLSSVKNYLYGIGASWTLNVPCKIILPEESFYFISEGKYKELRKYILAGRMRPIDIAEDGESLLVRIAGYRNKCYKALLDTGARWDALTLGGVTNAYAAWDMVINWKRHDDPMAFVLEADLLKDHQYVQSLGFSGLHLIVIRFSNIDLETYLDVNPHELNIVDMGGRSALFWAVRLGNLSATYILLKRGANPRLITREGRNLLHYAAARTSVTLKYLLWLGLDVNLKDARDCSPLYLAAAAGRATNTSLLLRAGADPNPPDIFPGTALMAAVRAKKPRAVKFLVEAGADLEARDDMGRTPLLLAATFPSPAFEYLLSVGARPDAISSHGESIHALLGSYGDVETITAFRNSPSFIPGNPDEVDADGFGIWRDFELVREEPSGALLTKEERAQEANLRKAFASIMQGGDPRMQNSRIEELDMSDVESVYEDALG